MDTNNNGKFKMRSFNSVKLAHLPTPVEPLPRLSAVLGGPRIFVKRDDQTGLAFGGNKTRKLEYVLADALEKGAKCVVTGGSLQSNHCRQTAAAARRVGLECLLALAGEPPEHPSGNLLLDKLFGAEITYTTKDEREATMHEVYDKAVKAGRKPYFIPIGASNPLGAVGFAYGIKELIDQGTSPDWIVFASSSGGTQAGMVAGADLFGFPGKVLGISIDEPKDALQKKVAQIASETMKLFGRAHSTSPDEILVNTDYLGDGYGVMGALEKEAILMFARNEGILLDPVYTGRAAGGMIDLVRKGFFKKDESVLFWHTGGTPALLAEKYREVLG